MGSKPIAPRMDARTLFPRACNTCGVPKSTDGFHPQGNSGRWMRRCRDCDVVAGRSWRAENRGKAIESSRKQYESGYVTAWRSENRERHQATRSAWNDATREAATHHGEEWTSAQMEIIARPGLSLKEAAAMTGRTASAVSYMRAQIRNGNPKALSKLGYDPEKNDGL